MCIRDSPISKNPDRITFSPLVSKDVSAVYVADPAPYICFTDEKSQFLTPLNPTASDCIVASLPETAPLITSPGTNSPLTLETAITPCRAFPAAEKTSTLAEVIPSAKNNSKLFA